MVVKLLLLSITCWFCICISISNTFILFIRGHDFSSAKFDERTVMLCDQVGISSCFFTIMDATCHFCLFARRLTLSLFICLFVLFFFFSVKRNFMLVACARVDCVT